MMNGKLAGALGGALLVPALIWAVSSCAMPGRTVVSPPHVEGAHFVGNMACADCHSEIAQQFPSSPHAHFHREDLAWAGRTGCESCHGAGSEHIARGGERGLIVNPRKNPETCFECHLEVHAEFHLPAHHRVVEGRMSCVDCHDPHGSDIFKPAGGLAMARRNESCAQCHWEQAKPMVYEHEALREGCTVCHQPHGSIHRKMLVERDQNLCLKCHAQVQGMDVASDEVFIGKIPHGAFLSQGTCWSSGCHTAVHGSNINPLMLY